MASASADRRRQLLKIRRRLERQLRELAKVRAELHEINADQFTKPVAPDAHAWLFAIEPTRRELTGMLADVEVKLAGHGDR